MTDSEIKIFSKALVLNCPLCRSQMMANSLLQEQNCPRCARVYPLIEVDFGGIVDFRPFPCHEDAGEIREALRAAQRLNRPFIERIKRDPHFASDFQIKKVSPFRSLLFWVNHFISESTRFLLSRFKTKKSRQVSSYQFYRYKIQPLEKFMAKEQERYMLHRKELCLSSRKAFTFCAIDSISEQIRNHQMSTVLDFGCGLGRYLVWLSGLFPQVSFWGFDYAAARVLATQLYIQMWGEQRINLFAGDGASLPLVDKSVDLVYSIHVLEQIADKAEACVREMVRIAKKKLILIEPYYEQANVVQRIRINRGRYLTHLRKILKKFPLIIEKDEHFEFSDHPLNPSGLVIAKLID